MKFDLVVNLPTTNCLIYIDKFRCVREIRYQVGHLALEGGVLDELLEELGVVLEQGSDNAHEGLL